MARKMLRDILPKNNNNNNLVGRKARDSEGDVLYHKVSPPKIRRGDYGRSRKMIWSLVILVLVIVCVSFFYITSGVSVTVEPRSFQADINLNLTAINQKDFDSESDSDLVFKESVVSKIGGKDVPPDGERLVERKASGKITIYNEYSSAKQRLIKNTRFESPDGRIYRINQSVVVPGQKTVKGEVVPGSVEAVVYADEPGEKYNLKGLVSFTIPGLKSDSKRYSKFYAKNTKPLDGGFVGSMKYVSDENQKTVRAQIRASLENEIIREAQAGLSDGFFMPTDSYIVEFESLPTEEKGSGVSIKEKATLTMFIFKNTEWDLAVSSKVLPEEMRGSKVYIKNRNSLNIDWTKWPEKDVSEINFNVSGMGEFVWIIDSEDLQTALAGRKKRDLDSVVSNFPSVKSAKAVISPIWKRGFPDDGDKIEIIVEIPDNTN